MVCLIIEHNTQGKSMPDLDLDMREFANVYGHDAAVVENRRRELEWRARMSGNFARGADVFVDAVAAAKSLVRVFKPISRKGKKPLRQKKLKRITICTGCGCPLDPNGNLNRTRSRNFCNKCYKKLYFICLRCCQKRMLNNRSAVNSRLCNRCVRDMLRARQQALAKKPQPMPTRDVRWGLGSRIHGKVFDKVGSTRTFGVELETAECRYAERLEGKTSFGAKYDATCSGREFVSPILSGNEGLRVIRHFCDHAKRRGWVVDEGCGVHLHLGMQDEAEATVQRISVAYVHTYRTWLTLVAPDRAHNEYCCPPTVTPARLQSANDFMDYCSNVNRYQFINFAAYSRHTTLEIRGLEGTLDKNLITNWVIAHLAFADFAASSSYEELTRLFGGTEADCWENLKQHIGSTARYFGRVRAKRATE